MRWLSLALVAGCSGGQPYLDLGAPSDLVTSVGGKGNISWVRPLEGGVEILILAPSVGAEDGVNDHARLLINARDIDVYTGTFTYGSGLLTLTDTTHFILRDEEGTSMLSRDGSYSEDIEETLDYGITAEHGLFEPIPPDGDPYLHLDVVERAARTDILRTYQLCGIVERAYMPRIPGFNSVGMTQYLGEVTPFVGLIDGSLDLAGSGLATPVTGFEFFDLQDVSGVQANGSLEQQSNMGGDGWSYGTVEYRLTAYAPEGATIEELTAPGFQPYEGESFVVSVWYGNEEGTDGSVRHTAGYASAGSYKVTLDGQTELVGYDRNDPADFADWLTTTFGD